MFIAEEEGLKTCSLTIGEEGGLQGYEGIGTLVAGLLQQELCLEEVVHRGGASMVCVVVSAPLSREWRHCQRAAPVLSAALSSCVSWHDCLPTNR